VELKLLRRKKGELNLPLIYFAVAGASGFFLYTLYRLRRFPVFPCVFKEITGIACPTCGSTRSLICLSRFDIFSAFRFNPLVFIGIILFSLWGLYGFYVLFSGNKIQVILSKKEWRSARWGILVLILLNWIYLIAAGI
jgi:hypothetical protein